jgi:catechol 2,3-dioxygenase-like lactoylglutathione lyase family enzyme
MNNILGLRHVALVVKNLEACMHFYTTLLGMKLVLQPDPDNVHLSFGDDNLALHRATENFFPGKNKRLDHIGFFFKKKTDVDSWHKLLSRQGITISSGPKDHGDGTRGLICLDPDGNSVQLIWMGSLLDNPAG